MSKRKLLVGAVVLAVFAVTFGVIPMQPAAAQIANACTAVFNFTGAARDFTVPAGATQLELNVYGAAGGDATGSAQNIGEGGFGAGVVGAVLPVTAGDVLTVIVGGEGGPAESGHDFNPGGTGGFGYDGDAAGGVSGGPGGDATEFHGGGGGGGASAVLLNGAPVVAAGGGGGGAHGGDGGNAGTVGTAGTSVGTAPANAFGRGATSTAGGAGGVGTNGGLNGGAGAAGQGGAGGNAINTSGGPSSPGGDAGGGGGGGIFGGGGAGGAAASSPGGGAGGGGGSSMTTIGNIQDGIRDGDGRIDISLSNAQCPVDLAITKSASLATPALGEQVIYSISVTNSGPNGDTGVVVTDSLPAEVSYVSDNCGGRNLLRWTWTIGDLAANATETCQITVVAEQPGVAIPNTAAVSGDLPEINLANNEDDALITIPPPNYDLEITKSASPTQVLVGDQVTYTLTVNNLGPDDAPGASVADILPPQVAFVSDTCGGTRPNIQPPGGGTPWFWNVGALTADATATCTITVQVLQAGQITNTASVVSHGIEGGLGLTNNQDDAIVTVQPRVDLAIDKVGVLDPAARQITYTVTVNNLGPSDATGVVVTDPLPAQVSYLSDTCGGANSPPWTWQIGNLAAGATVACTVTVSVLATGTITNVATVDGSEPEVTEENNTNPDTLVVPAAVDLSIQKVASSTSATVGDQVTYTLTVNNLGPDAGTGVVVTDPLPTQVSYVSDTCGGANTPPWTWQIGNLAAGATVTCDVTVTASSSGEITNIATVKGNQEELKPDNNTSSATVTLNEPVAPPPPGPPPTGGLPLTGAPLAIQLLSLGVALTALGTMVALIARRPRRAPEEPKGL